MVTVFGEDGGLSFQSYELAACYPGSVGELTSILSPRIPRFYTRKGKIVGRWMNKNAKIPLSQGLIVIRYYLALRGAENGVTVMVTPFFCVQG